MKIWLDDIRDPRHHGRIGWDWITTADEAIEILKKGNVEEINLDHDLAWEHYPWNNTGEPYKEKTGYDVACWIRDNLNPAPVMHCHSANPIGKIKIQKIIDDIRKQH